MIIRSARTEKRRRLLKAMAAVPLGSLLWPDAGSVLSIGQESVKRIPGFRFKLSLNAYSFDALLREGSMSLEALLEYCAAEGFDAVDLTGYYFRGYPSIPSDEEIHAVKRKAFLLGLDISGTGVRNDFTYPDVSRREEDLLLVKRWIGAAAKLGAPVLRVFAGKQDTAGYTREQVAAWIAADLKECAACGAEHGVMIGIQNHNDHIKTADQAIKILEMVDSPWCGLIVDTGSFRSGDPYAEIAKVAPHAINWQIKEHMFVNGDQVPVDLRRLAEIIRAAGYRGYLPIETLGPGDPRLKVPAFLGQVRSALGSPR